MTINQRIFQLMEKHGYTKANFAKGTGIKPNTISDWATKGTNPSADKIYRICEFLQVSTDYLLTGQEKSPGLKPELAEIIRCYEQSDPETKAYVKGLLGVRPVIQLDKDEEQFIATARKVYRQEKDEESATSSVKELDVG